ncbi:MAG: shikimate dehydrogenase [Syntrophales bacterium]|nr:shikimate dehydrogenase [Syntrophales bacterium]
MNSNNYSSTRPAPTPDQERGGLFAIFGNPLGQSLSPLMLNAAFAEMGLTARYGVCQTGDAAEAVRWIREMDLRGASVTLPLKETVMPFLDEVDRNAREIGAVNTIVHRDGRLRGYNTDSPGLVRDLEEWIGISGKTFVVLGAGGAARAALFSLLQAGGTPVVVNRTPERAEALAGRFGCRWVPITEIGCLQADCLINTTPVGMFPEADRTPLPKRELARFPRVMDMIYNPNKTRLLREAGAAGCIVRSGVGMFVHQGAEQFRLWTGMEPPRERMRQAVLERLGENGGD